MQSRRHATYASGMLRIPLVVLLLLPLTGQAAQIYRYLDEEGNVVFSSQPPPGRPAERLTLPPVNAVAGPKPEAPAEHAPPAESAPSEPYPGFRIVAPEQESSVRANNGDFNITLHTDAPLRPGHQVVLLFDGSEVARGPSLTFAMQNVDRGEHTAQAKILDQNGRTLATTDPVTFTVQRVAVGGR